MDIPGVPEPGYYPGDLSNPNHGPVMTQTLSHAVYINMLPSHWGAPGTYLKDLGESTFIHLVDQYVGSSDSSRYTPGVALQITNFPINNNTLTTTDLVAILHAVAAFAGHGYGHVYHIFTPEGVEYCFNATTCYSPDDPKTFVFCAFHSSLTFKDSVGHVVFTFEPFQDVPGCRTAPGSVNGPLIDSTDDTLSHEMFETITDPDGNAWWVHNNVSLFGDEIGDLCSRFGVVDGKPYFVNPVVTIGDHQYNIAGEYSNAFHACAYRPLNVDH